MSHWACHRWTNAKAQLNHKFCRAPHQYGQISQHTSAVHRHQGYQRISSLQNPLFHHQSDCQCLHLQSQASKEEQASKAVQADQDRKAVILPSGNNGYTATAVNISHTRSSQASWPAVPAPAQTLEQPTSEICLTSANLAQTSIHTLPVISKSSTEHSRVLPRAVTTTVPLLPAAPSPAGVGKQVQTLPTLVTSAKPTTSQSFSRQACRGCQSAD